MKYVIVAVMCLMIGILIGKILFRPKQFGDLRVDRSDPDDPPHLFLELDADISHIIQQEYVTFKVRAEDFLKRG